jgi:hypothetical protein
MGEWRWEEGDGRKEMGEWKCKFVENAIGIIKTEK